jgi:hypothetical protein
VVFVVLVAVAVVAVAETDPLLHRVITPAPAVALTPVPAPQLLSAIDPADIGRLPVFSQKPDGSHQEPISLIFVGTLGDLKSAYVAAGWSVADPPSFTNLLHAMVSALANQPYPRAPVTPDFLDGKVQDVAFEKPEGAATIRRRHHSRWWVTGFTLAGSPICVGTASFDSHLELGSAIPLPTHHIEPDIDAERAYEVRSLASAKRAVYVGLVRVTRPTGGTNAQGDRWFTDGLAAELVYPRF